MLSYLVLNLMYILLVNQNLISKGAVLTEEQQTLLIQPFTVNDVKRALWSIDGNKAPGYDGFSSQFFKDAWETVGDDLCNAVLDFFKTGRMLQQVNTTILTLIPKNKSPKHVSEFRPIACCCVVYKCISKLLCTRLKMVLSSIINEAQSAFVEGRQIVHNVMLVQELMSQYKRKGITPRCVMKIDLRKA